MRVMCADVAGDHDDLELQWEAIATRAQRDRPDLVVLPELPFSPWLPASPEPDDGAWQAAVETHVRWLDRLVELGAEVVVTSRPVTDQDGTRAHEAIVWTRTDGIVAGRRKTYLPDEPGFHEARWYERGRIEFPLIATPVARMGVMLCTELWFPEHARQLGEQGAQVIAGPRATPVTSLSRWEAAARVLAIVAGAYCVTANRGGACGDVVFGGGSLIVDPEGNVLAHSAPDAPVAVADIDLDVVDTARTTYPRYVDASPR